MTQQKSEKMAEFCEFVVRYCALHSEERLTATTISRGINVSRAWIYKYFGSKRDQWLKIAANEIGQLFTEDTYFPNPKDPENAEKIWKMGADRLLTLFEDRPWIGSLYFKYLGRQDHPLGLAIQDLENSFVLKATPVFEGIYSLPNARAKSLARAMTYRRMSLAHAWVRQGPERLQVNRQEWLRMLLPSTNL